MKVDIYDLIKTALENNHVTISIKDWPAAVLGSIICIAYAYVKTVEVNASKASNDFQQNKWTNAA